VGESKITAVTAVIEQDQFTDGLLLARKGKKHIVVLIQG
jgi:hypothetical protein